MIISSWNHLLTLPLVNLFRTKKSSVCRFLSQLDDERKQSKLLLCCRAFFNQFLINLFADVEICVTISYGFIMCQKICSFKKWKRFTVIISWLFCRSFYGWTALHTWEDTRCLDLCTSLWLSWSIHHSDMKLKMENNSGSTISGTEGRR